MSLPPLDPYANDNVHCRCQSASRSSALMDSSVGGMDSTLTSSALACRGICHSRGSCKCECVYL